jgi:hypothetical protein
MEAKMDADNDNTRMTFTDDDVRRVAINLLEEDSWPEA